VTRTSALCAIYPDCRLTPASDPVAIRRKLVDVMKSRGIPGEVELFVYRRSYEAGDTGVLLDGLRKSHAASFGTELELAAPVISSMWRDISIFNEMGIPSITYGPPRNFRRPWMIVRTAEIYANVAIEVCNTVKLTK
jgi:hypothetical protein